MKGITSGNVTIITQSKSSGATAIASRMIATTM
jgi:hypothetical protein